MSAQRNGSSKIPPAENAEYPAGPESEAVPGIGRQADYLKQNRAASGGLDDDPTDSGAPVKNRRSFQNLTGGR